MIIPKIGRLLFHLCIEGVNVMWIFNFDTILYSYLLSCLFNLFSTRRSVHFPHFANDTCDAI